MAHSESRTRRVVGGPPELVGVDGPAAGVVYDVGDELIVGRSPDVDVHVDDQALSRRHFRLYEVGGTWCLEDLRSANGTVLNGARLRRPTELSDGDVITAGHCGFEVRFPVASAERADDDVDALLRSEPTHAEPMPQFRGYRVVRRLGEGNMGRLWLVERQGRFFALKHLRSDVTLSEQDRERFLREAASLRALRHTHIVGFVDSGQDGGQFFYVMQFVDGVDLDVYRRQAGGRIPVERCLRLTADVLDGLDYAHRKGFVHRDVKPANVLVGVERGRMVPKLTDFGLAKRYEAAADMITRGYISFGTPDYMPPEQVTSFKAIGPASDIYAMGATMYHLLSGYTAYKDVAGPDPIRTLLTVDPVPLADRAPWLPPGLCAVVDRAMRREPGARWSSAGEFATRIRALLSV